MAKLSRDERELERVDALIRLVKSQTRRLRDQGLDFQLATIQSFHAAEIVMQSFNTALTSAHAQLPPSLAECDNNSGSHSVSSPENRVAADISLQPSLPQGAKSYSPLIPAIAPIPSIPPVDRLSLAEPNLKIGGEGDVSMLPSSPTQRIGSSPVKPVPRPLKRCLLTRSPQASFQQATSKTAIPPPPRVQPRRSLLVGQIASTRGSTGLANPCSSHTPRQPYVGSFRKQKGNPRLPRHVPKLATQLRSQSRRPSSTANTQPSRPSRPIVQRPHIGRLQRPQASVVDTTAHRIRQRPLAQRRQSQPHPQEYRRQHPAAERAFSQPSEKSGAAWRNLPTIEEH